MPDAFILSAARTPIGRARKGSLVSVDAYQLAEVAVSAAVERSQVPIPDLDDLVLAESLQGGGVIARNIAVRLGMTGVPGVAVNRHCASGATGAVGGRHHHVRHGRCDRCRRNGERQHHAPALQSGPRRTGTHPVVAAEPSRCPRSARLRHVDHHRGEHRPATPRDPRAGRRVVGAVPPASPQRVPHLSTHWLERAIADLRGRHSVTTGARGG